MPARAPAARVKPALHLFAMDGDVTGRDEAKFYAVAANVEHRDDDVLTDDNPLARFAAKHQHRKTSL